MEEAAELMQLSVRSLSFTKRRSSEFYAHQSWISRIHTFIFTIQTDQITQQCPVFFLSYLYHVNKVVEILHVINGQLIVLIYHSVMDDLSGDTDAQDVVTRVADRLSHQEQAILGRLQLTHRLRAGDVTMKPAS